MSADYQQQLHDLEAHLPDLERRVEEDVYLGRDSGAFLLLLLTRMSMGIVRALSEVERRMDEAEGD